MLSFDLSLTSKLCLTLKFSLAGKLRFPFGFRFALFFLPSPDFFLSLTGDLCLALYLSLTGKFRLTSFLFYTSCFCSSCKFCANFSFVLELHLSFTFAFCGKEFFLIELCRMYGTLYKRTCQILEPER